MPMPIRTPAWADAHGRASMARAARAARASVFFANMVHLLITFRREKSAFSAAGVFRVSILRSHTKDLYEYRCNGGRRVARRRPEFASLGDSVCRWRKIYGVLTAEVMEGYCGERNKCQMVWLRNSAAVAGNPFLSETKRGQVNHRAARGAVVNLTPFFSW